jgi:hypothetical protein
LGRHLHQIEVELASLADRLTRVDDADLLAVWTDQTDLWSSDPVVDTWIG